MVAAALAAPRSSKADGRTGRTGDPMELQGHVRGHLAGGMGWGCPGLSPSLAAETTCGGGGVEGPTDQVPPASGPLALVPPISHGL